MMEMHSCHYDMRRMHLVAIGRTDLQREQDFIGKRAADLDQGAFIASKLLAGGLDQGAKPAMRRLIVEPAMPQHGDRHPRRGAGKIAG
jgi:hypothetical protein